MSRRAVGAALILVAAAAQVSWAPQVEVAGAFPNLVLLAIVAVAWSQGVRPAMVWACVGGLLLDLMAAGPVGLHALALLLVGYLTGFFSRNLNRQGVVFVAVSAAVGTAAYSMVLVGVGALLGEPPPALDVIWRLTLAACAYNAILAPVAAAAVRRLGGRSPVLAESA